LKIFNLGLIDDDDGDDDDDDDDASPVVVSGPGTTQAFAGVYIYIYYKYIYIYRESGLKVPQLSLVLFCPALSLTPPKTMSLSCKTEDAWDLTLT